MIAIMNTKVKNFPYGLDEKDLLYLIWKELKGEGAEMGSPRRVEVLNIAEIPGGVLDSLECGDQVAKVTGVQKHLYTVSYKGEGVGEGICLTYVAAGLIETVSYDYTANGWVYNSVDKCTIAVD